MKAIRWVLCGLLLTVVTGPAAADIKKGSSILAIQLTEGAADFIGPARGGYVGAYDHSEMGVQVQYWNFIAEGCAVNLSGGIGHFAETDKPGSTAAAGDQDFKYTQTSWQARVGIDHVAHLDDRFHLFIGPGIQVWNGKAKFEGGPAPVGPAIETGKTLRVALSGRIGVHVRMNERVGVFGQLGHYFGYATAKDKTDKDAKATWWPSGHDGAAGVAFTF